MMETALRVFGYDVAGGIIGHSWDMSNPLAVIRSFERFASDFQSQRSYEMSGGYWVAMGSLFFRILMPNRLVCSGSGPRPHTGV
jgi:hypothetical protein